jgi:hypothetical protein
MSPAWKLESGGNTKQFVLNHCDVVCGAPWLGLQIIFGGWALPEFKGSKERTGEHQ